MNFAYYNQERHGTRVVRYIALSVVLDLELLKLQPEITNSLSALVYVDTQSFSSPLRWILLWCLLNELIRARQIWEQTGCNKTSAFWIKLRGAQLERKEGRRMDQTSLFFPPHSVFLCHCVSFRINVNRCTEIKVFDYISIIEHTQRGVVSVCKRERDEIHFCHWKTNIARVFGAELLYSVRRTRQWCTQTAVLPHLIYNI